MADSGDADDAALSSAAHMPFRCVIVALLFGCNICLYYSRACITVAVIYMFEKDENAEGALLCAFYRLLAHANCRRLARGACAGQPRARRDRRHVVGGDGGDGGGRSVASA